MLLLTVQALLMSRLLLAALFRFAFASAVTACSGLRRLSLSMVLVLLVVEIFSLARKGLSTFVALERLLAPMLAAVMLFFLHCYLLLDS